MSEAIRARRRRESGTALIVSILMLVLLTAMGIAALDTVSMDNEVAGYQKRARAAFFAAEAGAATARQVVRNMGARSELPVIGTDFPDAGSPATLSTAADFVRGQPQYYADPAITQPIKYIGEGGACTEGCDLNQGGIKFNHTRWQINVVGESAEGSAARLEVVATRMLPVGY